MCILKQYKASLGENRVIIKKSRIEHIIKEELRRAILEAHGLSGEDAKVISDFADETDDKNLKRILKFIVKSNVEVDKTQDVTKMKKKNEGEELEERCQKGYKTHPTRKTKKMFGRTYRNCVKAEGVDGDVAERKLEPGEKRRLKSLEKKISKSDFVDRYGQDEGESIYYATLTKMAKKGKKK